MSQEEASANGIVGNDEAAIIRADCRNFAVEDERRGEESTDTELLISDMQIK